VEGKEYRSRGACVRIDDTGIDIRDWYLGGRRLPWPVIVDVKAGTRAIGGAKRRCLELEIVDGSRLILPAPIGPPRGSALFEEQAREIFQACGEHGAGGPTGPAGEARDEIPTRYRMDQLRRVEVYAGPSPLPLFGQPLNIYLLLLFLVGLVGIVGSVHSYTRDLGGYDAYRAARSCTASVSAAGSAGPAYCIVDDGVVTQALTQLDGSYSVDVGPASDPDASVRQHAVFKTDPSALNSLAEGASVDYVAADGGDVASITYDGTTYRTTDSPQSQDVYDWASVFRSLGWMLFIGGLLALRVTRRGLLSWGMVPVLMVATAFVVNITVAMNRRVDQPPASVGSLLGLTGAFSVFTAVVALCLFVLIRQVRRPVSPRHRGRP
jgi:hypothetical protein